MSDQEQQIEQPKEVIRVSISEAAKLFGVSTQTIRRALKDKELTYVIVGGRYKLNFETLVRWSQVKTTVRNKTEKQGIGQYVERWKIRNTLYSPSPKLVKKKTAKKESTSVPMPIGTTVDKQ